MGFGHMAFNLLSNNGYVNSGNVFPCFMSALQNMWDWNKQMHFLSSVVYVSISLYIYISGDPGMLLREMSSLSFVYSRAKDMLRHIVLKTK